MNIFKKLNFKNPWYLQTALTHRSYLNEHRNISQSNERLEFLGDAVLEVVVSYYLFKKFKNKPEGELTSMRSKIVQTKTLAKTARELNLPSLIKMSKGEAENGGRENDSILADAFEAVVGAVFLDQGLKAAAKFIEESLLVKLKKILESEETVDYKSLFQEIIQARKKPTPEYKIIDEKGPDHNKIFTAEVLVAGKEIAKGIGKTKQMAEQQAAKVALEKIKKGL